jgi:hypothetical protein
MPPTNHHQHRHTRRSAAANGTTHIAAISIVLGLLLIVAMYWLWRRRRSRKAAAARASKSRAYVNAVFPRQNTQDPDLPPYSASPASSQRRTRGGSSGAAAGERNGDASNVDLQAVLRAPPPARVHTPPGYGQHVADREAGPLSEQPPAYDEEGRVRWGRSGVFR